MSERWTRWLKMRRWLETMLEDATVEIATQTVTAEIVTMSSKKENHFKSYLSPSRT